MNSSNDCHEIESVSGLFVDAFKGTYLKKTSNSNNTFILTHYHGDHYQRLPKEFKYAGPAKIHCTPITAALLREVHQVEPQFVVEHEYGETWELQNKEAKITLYDANHCPGAAIVLIELTNGNTHLHCGDMRYSPRMKDYPLLKLAVEKRKMDIVYLDTTYGHPKHSFCPQQEAVNQIASVVDGAIKDDTLVLLSCYSIGKEKVLWECSKRAKQPIFVTERKHKMLQCCYDDKQVEELCTLDATKTDIHVIPMGLAGELWPYFQPNYPACRDYVEKLDHKRYSKVVAFLPTGWANGSNWNKKNAVVSQSMPLKNSDRRVDIEIRLISYSEHSAFTELVDFVTFLKPRKVLPTVYSDDGDRRKITNHFRNLMDSTRAKQNFFASMKRSLPTTTCTLKGSPSGKKVKTTATTTESARNTESQESPHVSQLVAMGFTVAAAEQALRRSQGRLDAAVEHLLSGGNHSDGGPDDPVEILCDSSPPPPPIKRPSIASYFSPKKP